MKKFKMSISLISAMAILGTMLTSSPVIADGTTAIDLALTKTNYPAIGDSGKIMVCQVENGERREEITSGLTFTSSDESIIENIGADGSFTTKGFGVVRVDVVYDNGTADDTADDIKGAVMINCYDGSAGNAVLEHAYVNNEQKIQRELENTYISLGGALEAKDDPMQNGRKIIGESNNTPVACITKNATELNEDINSVVFSGWFYDDGSYVSQLGFSFDIKHTIGDRKTSYRNHTETNHKFNLNVSNFITNPVPYIFEGGMYAMKNVRQDYVAAVNGTTDNYGSISDVARKKGWHQMTAVAEPSIIMPGNDYMLVKGYIDGTLVTSQDVYVGNVPIEERAFGFFFGGQNVGQSKYVYYDDVMITKYTVSKAVRDIVPADGAQNVPVSSDVRIKFTDRVTLGETSFILSDGSKNIDLKADLDATGTVVTIKPAKLEADTLYTLSAGSGLTWEDGSAIGGIAYSFKTSNDTALAQALGNMNEYAVQTARYIDFGNSQKDVQEYGVGFAYAYHGTGSTINADQSATFTESVRGAVAASKRNLILIRNLSDLAASADRIVVSYKFKSDISKITAANGFSGGMGWPYMAKKDTAYTYDNRSMGLLSGGKLDILPAGGVGTAQNNQLVRLYPLQGNQDGSSTGYNENAEKDEQGNWKWSTTNAGNGNVALLEDPAQSVNSAVNLKPDADGYYRMTYVMDVDTAGQSAPEWTVIFGDNFEDKDNIFALHTEPINKTAYTSADSLAIPLLNGSTAIGEANSVTIKDVEIYNLKKKAETRIDDTIVVTDSETKAEIPANGIAGKTVDIELNAYGNGEQYTTIVAAYNTEHMLLNVAVASGNIGQDVTNIGIADFAVPADSTRLCVYVWNSLDGAFPLVSRIDYTSAE